MPKARSKAHQRFFFAAARRKGSGISKAEAHRRARRGKAFKRMPNRVKKRKRR